MASESTACFSLLSTVSPTHEIYTYNPSAPTLLHPADSGTKTDHDDQRWHYTWIPKFLSSLTHRHDNKNTTHHPGNVNVDEAAHEECPPRIHFVTSRSAKFGEVSKLMTGFELIKTPLNLPTLEKTHDLSLIAVYRAHAAFKILNAPCFLEECALDLVLPDYQHAFPGRYFKEVAEDMMGRRQFASTFNHTPAKLYSKFAYTRDGMTFHVFSGTATGRIHCPDETAWIEGDGWDPIVILSGYTLPISALTRWKHIIHLRQMPCAEMLGVIHGRDFSGVYETHITIYNDSQCTNESDNPLVPSKAHLEKFQSTCSKLGVKALVIHMDHASKPVQLQTAAYHCYKNYANAQRKAYELAGELIRAGLPVRRVRLEAMLHNQDTPKTDAEALLSMNQSNYFEFHTRLSWVNGDDIMDSKKALLHSLLQAWKPTCALHSPESKIKLSTSSAGTSKLFANGRFYGLGASSALTEWDCIVRHLISQGFVAEKHVKPEYCVYDEAPNADYILQASVRCEHDDENNA